MTFPRWNHRDSNEDEVMPADRSAFRYILPRVPWLKGLPALRISV